LLDYISGQIFQDIIQYSFESLVVLASVNPFPPFSESQDNGTLLKDWKKKVNDIAWDLFDDKFFSISSTSPSSS